MTKQGRLRVENVDVSIYSNDQEEDYICLTDMAKGKDDDSRAADVIKNWIRNKNTIEFLGAWEQLYNPDFKVVEFDHFRSASGSNAFVLSPKEWAEQTNSIGIFSKSGRYGGTYAHKDIAFEFGAWISPMFKLYLIKEYQRLKKAESDTYNLEWDIKRVLSKVNYHIHTDAVKNHIIPKSKFPIDKQWLEYAEEADILNMALFGCTAKEWRDQNPEHAKDRKNLRDFASINELTVLSNLESLNSEMIKLGSQKKHRYTVLHNTARDQMKQLKDLDLIKAVRKQNNKTYLEAQEKSGEELHKETSKSILNKNINALDAFKKKPKDSEDK